MKAVWIGLVLRHNNDNAVMTLSFLRTKKYIARMNWRHKTEGIAGKASDTIEDAIASLDDELCQDAADEMCEKGKA